jgi:hypothetical protein
LLATPPGIQSQVDLDNLTFVNNDRLRERVAGTTATPVQAMRRFASTPKRGCAR